MALNICFIARSQACTLYTSYYILHHVRVISSEIMYCIFRSRTAVCYIGMAMKGVRDGAQSIFCLRIQRETEFANRI